MSAEQVFAPSENFVHRVVADEAILVPIASTVGDLDSIFSLNPVGAFIWERIDGRNSLSAICGMLVAEFEVTPRQARDDLDRFIEELRAIGAVRPVGPERP